MTEFDKEYPKTYFAMMALASAVAEETAGKEQRAVRAIASTAIAVTAMKMASVIVGNDIESTRFGSDAVLECVKLLSMCLDGTIHTTMEEENETHAN